MCINNLVIWCNQNEGFLSAILASASLVVSGIALYISSNMEKKQYKNALYEKKLAVLENLDKLMEFINYLELYEKRFFSNDLGSINSAINIIQPSLISMSWVYEFRKAKFVVGKVNCKYIENISKWVSELLRNYRIFKESVAHKFIDNEDIENVFSNIQNIKDAVQPLREEIENDLYL